GRARSAGTAVAPVAAEADGLPDVDGPAGTTVAASGPGAAGSSVAAAAAERCGGRCGFLCESGVAAVTPEPTPGAVSSVTAVTADVVSMRQREETGDALAGAADTAGLVRARGRVLAAAARIAGDGVVNDDVRIRESGRPEVVRTARRRAAARGRVH